jgi:prephenate dehydrogenase
MPDDPGAVLIIGGRGEFGRFLQREILPALGVHVVLTIERDTPPAQHASLLEQSRHIVLATPLADYAQRACGLVQECLSLTQAATLWLIPSVQAGVWRAITATLENVFNPYLSIVFVHPMYGPNGFRADDRAARTFRNILTATAAGTKHPLVDEITKLAEMFRQRLSIETTTQFGPEEHDRITAYSQGLSYCVALKIFTRPEIDASLRTLMPDLHFSFHANRELIFDFLRLNNYMPGVLEVFEHAWQHTPQSSYQHLLQAFAQADETLNHGRQPAIPTKWYEKLRSTAIESRFEKPVRRL